MPNKVVNHTNLDNAIKNSLLNTQAEAKVEWEEIYNSLPKKSTSAKGPLADINFSLNSFVGVATSGSLTKIKSGILFLKKSSLALYITIGATIIGGGSFILYNSFSKNTNSLDKLVTPAREIHPLKSPEINTITQEKINEANNTTLNTQQTITTTESVNVLPSNNSSEIIETSTANIDMPLIKTPAQYEKTILPDEPVQLKTGNTAQNSDYDFSPSIVGNEKPDTTNNANQQNGETKKGKVLYYKESLSLDKLEQQISTDKNRKDE